MPAQKLVDKHSLKILNMEPANIPQNRSHHQLVTSADDTDSVDTTAPPLLPDDGRCSVRGAGGISLRDKITVAVLCYVNLINYMDRFTIAGILKDIQDYYHIGDDMGGLLQTAFVLSYMVFAPVFGYLGDRYSRKIIMAFGVLLWSLTTLAGSYMETIEGFMAFRALVGIGEASYSTIAPTVISDLFVKGQRSGMLALFYFAIPIGSGLGYIVGSEITKATKIWQMGLRVTPVMGLVAVLLIMFAMKDPARGESEGRVDDEATTWTEDIVILVKNRSFMFSTAGFTCVAFVTGALAWWGPTYIHAGLVLQPGHENDTINDVSYVVGILAMVSGLIGVPLGSYTAQYLRPRYPKVDPLICAVGSLASMPLIFIAVLMAGTSSTLCYIFIFFGQIFLNLTWAIVADMLLYVVIPRRRSTAEAFQILFSHAFGDACSPYLIGVISEALKGTLGSSVQMTAQMNYTSTSSPLPPEDPEVTYRSLQYALFTTSFVEILGGIFFLITAMYIIADRRKAESHTEGSTQCQAEHIYAHETSEPLVPS